jgi:hypothetical protein
MSNREIVEGMVEFLINNRNSGLSVDRVFEIFWRFNKTDYEVYSSEKTCRKIFKKMWKDEELKLLIKR